MDDCFLCISRGKALEEKCCKKKLSKIELNKQSLKTQFVEIKEVSRQFSSSEVASVSPLSSLFAESSLAKKGDYRLSRTKVIEFSRKKKTPN